tara:strand:- start:361 stop:534 length:174 start_codon:yes stop_codon:yes gene_type:complete
MKTHLIDIEATYLNVPSWLKEEMKTDNTKQAVCGYLRKNTTSKKEDVTCKLCKREMK